MGALGEPSPATTARGLQPPPSYPIPPASPLAAPPMPPPLPIYVPPPTPASAATTYVPPPAPTYVPPPAAPGPRPPLALLAPPLVAAPAPPVLLEVTPRGLGIATVAGYCEELIRRNARVPTEIRKLFTTSRDHQDLVRIVVCQGESRRLDNNTVIGGLVLQNLPPRPRR